MAAVNFVLFVKFSKCLFAAIIFNSINFLIMKKIILFSLLLFAFSCTQPKISTAEVEKQEKQYNWHYYHVVEIDSCEYLESDSYTGGITHKGNCKYCAIRNKK